VQRLECFQVKLKGLATSLESLLLFSSCTENRCFAVGRVIRLRCGLAEAMNQAIVEQLRQFHENNRQELYTYSLGLTRNREAA
jgi:hypothetical protein